MNRCFPTTVLLYINITVVNKTIRIITKVLCEYIKSKYKNNEALKINVSPAVESHARNQGFPTCSSSRRLFKSSK